MDDKLEFRFVTRTLSDDYHVFADGGKSTFSDQTEFAPLRKKCGIMSEEGPCAVLFEENGKIFLVAVGMSSGRKDVAGRPIRFSFCQIFQDAGQTSKEYAYAAFMRVVRNWNDVQEKVQALFHESLKESKHGEMVSFDQNFFMEWLKEGRISDIQFEICKHGDVRYLSDIIWPSEGCILKWKISENDDIVCMRFCDRASM